MKKICPRCLSAFTCREDRTDVCRCTHIYMVPGSRDYIKDYFNKCLCPACQKEISDNYNGIGINPKYKLEEQ